MHKRETIFDQKSQECSFISWEMGTTTALTGWVLWILGSRHPGPCIVGKCFGSVLVSTEFFIPGAASLTRKLPRLDISRQQ